MDQTRSTVDKEECQQRQAPRKSKTVQVLRDAFGFSNSDDSGPGDGNNDDHDKPIPSFNLPTIFKPMGGFSSSLPHQSVVCKKPPPSRQQVCVGHTERILSVDFSPDGRYVATASQDSTVRIWRGQYCVATLNAHSTKYECLRVCWGTTTWQSLLNKFGGNDPTTTETTNVYWLASGGADGVVNIWSSICCSANDDPTKWNLRVKINHCQLQRMMNNDDGKELNDGDGGEGGGTPQIYALEWIDNWQGLDGTNDYTKEHPVLLTASDDYVHLWRIHEAKGLEDQLEVEGEGASIESEEVFSMRFEDSHKPNGGVTIGRILNNYKSDTRHSTSFIFPQMPIKTNGDDDVAGGGDVFGGRNRNPHGVVYVFDAAYSMDLAALAVALSDGTVRVVSGCGVCWNVIRPSEYYSTSSLSQQATHLTCLAWCRRTPTIPPLLVTASGLGDLSTWQIWPGYPTYLWAIFCGGHDRPVFGTCFVLRRDIIVSNNTDGEHNARDGNANTSDDECHLLSWGMDGRLLVWDATQHGTVTDPDATLLDNADYPLFSVAISRDRIVTGGGKEEDGIIVSGGVPFHSYKLI